MVITVWSPGAVTTGTSKPIAKVLVGVPTEHASNSAANVVPAGIRGIVRPGMGRVLLQDVAAAVPLRSPVSGLPSGASAENACRARMVVPTRDRFPPLIPGRGLRNERCPQ